jgi:hypothetical protein
MMALGEGEVYLCLCLVSGQLHAQDRFTPFEITAVRWMDRQVAPRVGLDGLSKKIITGTYG